MKTLISFFVSFVVVFPLCAQNTWSKSFEILNSNDEAWDIVISKDKLYLQVVGFCSDGSSCSSLVEMNTNGVVIQNYNLEQSNYLFDIHNTMLLENNRILNLATSSIVDTSYNGTISSFELNKKQFIHKKLAFKKGLFVPTNIEKWQGSSNYIILGQFQTIPNNAEDTWSGLFLVDSSLNIILDTILNKDFYSLSPTDFFQDSDTSFTYFVKGCKQGKCSNLDGIKLYSYRINNKLEIIDSTILNRALDFTEAASTWSYVEPSSDQTYLLTWKSNNQVSTNIYQPYLCKLNNKGEDLWKTNFFVNTYYSYFKSIHNLLSLKNGDYLIIGSNQLSPKKSLGIQTGWAARLNAEGKILWERNYYNKVPADANFPPLLSLIDGVEGEDGSIYMCGFLIDTIPGITPSQINLNNWVIKVGPDGCLTPGCTDSLIYVATTEIKNLKQDLLQIVPTLADQIITANWKDAPTETNHIFIRSIEGSILKDIVVQGKAGQTNIEINNLPSGMYFATIQGNGWQGMPVKFVKQ